MTVQSSSLPRPAALRRRGAAVLACGAAAVTFSPGFIASPSDTAQLTQRQSTSEPRSLANHGLERASATSSIAANTAIPPTALNHKSSSIGGMMVGGFAAAVGLVGGRLARRARGGADDDVPKERKEVPLEIRGFSLAQAVLAIGALLIIISFGDYFIYGAGGGGGVGGLTFIYAPLAIILGAALQYAELKPIEVDVEKDAIGLFDEKATKTLQQIKQDVTRHRYGDDAHLDTTLKTLGFRAASGKYPMMTKIIEAKAANGELEFQMLFQSKEIPFTTWSDPMKIIACDRFFGPGIWTEITKYDKEKRIACLKLTTGARPSDKPAPDLDQLQLGAAAEEGVKQAPP
eukprot:TRINITY_DN82080_c0_g1_i1.p1 TRINITY_DN82080_c0_g1~~TRINITY_DN82080_c0_g1_i1.p1  ORF type:complete len:346 (+),score=73.85 TRINITY_DN82080_c0_g1_i1:85-1122(+)